MCLWHASVRFANTRQSEGLKGAAATGRCTRALRGLIEGEARALNRAGRQPKWVALLPVVVSRA